MISPLDDFPVHHGAAPVDHASIHPDFVEHFELFAFDDVASVVVALRFSVHPAREVIDASCSVVTGGRQRSWHASARLPARSGHLVVGPCTLDVVEPMRRLDAGVSATELGIQSALSFTADAEPISYRRLESTEAIQWGRAILDLDVDGDEIARRRSLVCVRHRAWGVEGHEGVDREWRAPAHLLPQFFRYRLALGPGRARLVAAADEESDGWRRYDAAVLDGELGQHHFAPRWRAGSRWCEGGTVQFRSRGGRTTQFDLETLAVVPARGFGLTGPDWSTGAWHDELATGTEAWRIDELDPTDVHHVRALHVVRVTTDGAAGLGLLDLVAIGPHHPSGLVGFTDGA